MANIDVISRSGKKGEVLHFLAKWFTGAVTCISRKKIGAYLAIWGNTVYKHMAVEERIIVNYRKSKKNVIQKVRVFKDITFTEEILGRYLRQKWVSFV